MVTSIIWPLHLISFMAINGMKWQLSNCDRSLFFSTLRDVIIWVGIVQPCSNKIRNIKFNVYCPDGQNTPSWGSRSLGFYIVEALEVEVLIVMNLVVSKDPVSEVPTFIRGSWGWGPYCQGCHSWGSYNLVQLVEVLVVEILVVEVLIFEVL